MNANTVVDAIANKQYNAAEEAIAEMLQSKVSDALVAKKEEVSQDFGSQLGEAKHDKDYDEFFNKAMKKFGISSPADLKTDEKKKEFFDYVDKNFKAKNEEVELDEAVTVDIEFKKDADGAAAVGSETGRKGLVVSGKKVRDKVYKMTFTNDAMMNKFMDKYESKLNEEVELDEKEHTGKPDSKALMNKLKSKLDGMSQEEKDELLSGAKEILKNMKTMKTEEFGGGGSRGGGGAGGAGGAGGGGGVKPGEFRGVGTNITKAINNLIPGNKKNKRRRIIRRFFRDLIDQSPLGQGVNAIADVAAGLVLALDPNQGQGSGSGGG